MPVEFLDENPDIKGSVVFEDVKADPLAERKAFEERYLDGNEGGIPGRAARSISDLYAGIVKKPIEALGAAAYQIPAGFISPQEGTSREASLLEGSRKLGTGILNVGAEAVPTGVMDALKRINRFQTAGIPDKLIEIVKGKPTDEESIQKAFDEEQKQKALQEGDQPIFATSTGENPFGSPDPTAVEGVENAPSALAGASLVGGAAKGMISNAVKRKALAGEAARIGERTGLPASAKEIPKARRILHGVVDTQSADAGFARNVDTGRFDPVINELHTDFKPKTGAPGMVDALDKQIGEAIDYYKPVVQDAAPKLISPSVMMERAMEDYNLKALIPDAEERRAFLSNFEKNFKDMTPDNILEYAKGYNLQSNAFFASGEDLTAVKQKAALLAARNATSETIHDLIKSQGYDDSVYSKVGLKFQLKDRVRDLYSDALRADAPLVDVPLKNKVGPAVVSSVVFPFGGKAYKAKKIGTAFQKAIGTQSKAFNEQVNRLFEAGKIKIKQRPPRIPKLVKEDDVTKALQEWLQTQSPKIVNPGVQETYDIIPPD